MQKKSSVKGVIALLLVVWSCCQASSSLVSGAQEPWKSTYTPSTKLIKDTLVFPIVSGVPVQGRVAQVISDGYTCTFTYDTLSSEKTRNSNAKPKEPVQVNLKDVLKELQYAGSSQTVMQNKQTWSVDFRETSREIVQRISRDNYVVGREIDVVPDHEADIPGVQMFHWTKGDDCGHKWLTRNVTMRVLCDSHAQTAFHLLATLDEPEMCIYEMAIATPLVCDDARYPSLSQDGTTVTPLWTLQIRQTVDGVMCALQNTNNLATSSIFDSFTLSVSKNKNEDDDKELELIDVVLRGPNQQELQDVETTFEQQQRQQQHTLQSTSEFQSKLEYIYMEFATS